MPLDRRTWPERGLRWQLAAGQALSGVRVQQVVLRFPAGKSDDPSLCQELTVSAGWEWRQEGSGATLLLPFAAIASAVKIAGIKAEQSTLIDKTLTPKLWSTLDVPHMTVAIDYSVAGKTYQSSSEVEVSSRTASALFATLISVGLLLCGAWLVRRRAAGAMGGGRPGLLDSLLSLTVTPLGSYSLSMAQVLCWTALTLFGYAFLWLMTDGTPQIPPEILELLGVGSGTAVLSRLASGEKQALPARYLRLVPTASNPSLSDLVTVEGRPSIFKFQMLGFTLVTMLVLLRELYVNCHFATVSGSLVTLMGLSSATYLGNEVMQRNQWASVRQQIAKMEALALQLKISLSQESSLQRLMQEALAYDAQTLETAPPPPSDSPALPAPQAARTPLYRELLTLRALLIEIYSDLPPSLNPTPSDTPAPPAA